MDNVGTAPAKHAIDVNAVREDFPMLSRQTNGKALAYLDNAATAQKPESVIRRMSKFEAEEYAPARRGVYQLGVKAAKLFEEARAKVCEFINAGSAREIIFTSGATQAINLIAHSFGRKFIKRGEHIVISTVEHHANIIPWQLLCGEIGAELKVIPVSDSGELVMDEYRKLLCEKTKLVSVCHVSNALGSINPVNEITRLAHEVGARVLIDGAQAVPHISIDVRNIDCDFYAFSAHKMYGPTGVGVLYGRMEILEALPPYATGGEMANRVTLETTEFAQPPARFEAGTPPITQVIGLGATIDYLKSLGMENIMEYEKELLCYAENLLGKIEGLKIIGTAREKASIISFVMEQEQAHDVGAILDGEGIAVRGGHHCAQPTMERFGVSATTRASLAFYNSFDEIDRLAASIRKITGIHGGRV